VDIAIILITYGILFLGELGDKTQLIVFNLALEYKKFYKLGIGVTIGFALLVTIGVFFGVVITQFVPLFLISIVSGSMWIDDTPKTYIYINKTYFGDIGCAVYDGSEFIINSYTMGGGRKQTIKIPIPMLDSTKDHNIKVCCGVIDYNADYVNFNEYCMERFINKSV